MINVDAMVYAVNETLVAGKYINEVIHEAAGSWLLDGCHQLDGCKTGECKVTENLLITCFVLGSLEITMTISCVNVKKIV